MNDGRSDIFVATSNLGKLREIAPLFARAGRSVQRYAEYTSPIEGETSYVENAALKARSLSASLRERGIDEAVLADDSGLEVFALAGRPGVVSADYGGVAASWAQRRALLLAELAATGTTDRRARFVCAMHYIDRSGREFASLGTVDGEIALHERGVLGFSFDSIFVYSPTSQTFAELTDNQKNRISHRAIAAAAIIAAIEAAAVGLTEVVG